MKALLLVNGQLNNTAVLIERIRSEQFDLVVGVDGGSLNAAALGVGLDVVIGDMDSLTEEQKPGLGNPEYVPYPPEKDETDLELALLYALERGAERVLLVGVMGDRLDMTVSNIMLLAWEGFNNRRIEVWYGEQTAWIIRPPGGEINGSAGDTVSLLPMSSRVTGVTTAGLRYPLRHESLAFGLARGVSNVMDGETASVALASGLLLVVHTAQNHEKQGG